MELLKPEDLPFLTETKISRMEDLHYVLLLLSTIVHGGYFSLDNEIERCVIEYNDEFPYVEEILTKFSRIYNEIKKMNIPTDSMWYRKSNYFTMFVEIYNNTDEHTNFDDIFHKLIQFEARMTKSKLEGIDDDFSKYYGYMYSGTNSRQARVFRGDVFKSFVF